MANNRIQIKRSATTAAPSSLLPGELAFSNATGGSGVLFIGDTSNTVVVPIGGVRNPGTLTANQALVANSTSGIDKVIVANLVANSIWANGAAGSAGHTLFSNGSAIYWAAPAAGGGITEVVAGNGLTGGGSSGSVTVNVAAGNGISVSADAVAVVANGSSGLVSNTTGVHIKTGSGLGFDGTGNLQVTGVISVTDATVSGNLIVLGDLVSLNVATLSVEDNIITLAKDQNSSATYTDALDIGFFGTYGNTSNAFITGLFRDQSDSGIWKIFASNGAYTNTIIDTANTSAFKFGTLQSFLISGGLTTNSTSANLIANSSYAVGISSNAISLSGRANNDLLFTNSTGGITGLALNTTAGYVLQSNGTAIVYDWIDGGTF